MKHVFFIIFFTLSIICSAQNNRIKAGLTGVPIFQGGFGIITFGYEKLNNEKNKSWQFTANASYGSIAADAGSTNRKWFTLERINYINYKPDKSRLYYSFFIEAGNRIKLPGYFHPPPDSILNKTKSFEISPGLGAGVHFRIKKKFGIQISTGPKIIFAKTKDQYYNSITRKSYSSSYNGTKFGFRYMGTLSYQF